jgi:hypothetical protein
VAGDGGRQAEAYFWGILTMMSAPFLVLGIIGGLVYWQVRRARAPLTA